MRTPVVLGLTCLALLAPQATAQPALPKDLPKTVIRPKLFGTQAEFLSWTETYYQDPRPDLLDEAFQYFITSGLMNDEAKRVELAAFFGAALAITPGMGQPVRDVMVRNGTYDALFALVNALWLGDSDECRELLKAIAEKEPDPRVKEFITRRIQMASPIGPGKPITALSQIQLLWSQFGASGDPAIPQRIAEIIVTRYETSPEAMIFQQAAKDSIKLHGDSPQVREGLRRAIENAKPTPLREDAQELLTELSMKAAQPGAPAGDNGPAEGPPNP
jgi:hypothetical protein